MIEVPVRAFLDEKVAHYKDESLFSERKMQSATTFLVDALVDWMGPGGDPAFLTMFLLAGGKVDDLVAYVRLMSSTVERVHNERRRRMMVSAHKYAERTDKNLASRGYIFQTVPASVASWEDNDRILAGVLVESMADPDPLLSMYGSMMLASQRRVSRVMVGGDGWPVYCLAMEPVVDYRTMLLGELAEPWEVLPPPYGPYEAARRLP